MIQSRHGIALKEKIAEHRHALLEQMAAGIDANNYYWMAVGRVQGLADAIKLSEDADLELNGG